MPPGIKILFLIFRGKNKNKFTYLRKTRHQMAKLKVRPSALQFGHLVSSFVEGVYHQKGLRREEN